MDLDALILAASSAELDEALVSLFWIGCVFVLSPLVVRASRRLVPDVVVLLVLGAVIGPSVLQLASVGPGSSWCGNWAWGCSSCSPAPRSTRPRCALGKGAKRSSPG